MAKKRVHEIAKQQGLTSKEVLAALNAAGIEAKAAASSVEEADALKALGASGDGAAATAKPKTAAEAAQKPRGRVEGQARRQPTEPERRSRARSVARAATPPRGRPGRRPQAPPRRDRLTGLAARPDGAAAPQRPPRRRGGRRRRPLLEEPVEKPAEVVEPEATKVSSGATVSEVAETLGLSAAEVIKKLMQLGEMATLTQTLPDETISVLAKEFDQKVEIVSAAEEVAQEPEFEDADDDLVDRPPVVTIMGHVDHGKTSLLDAIRETEVVAGEAGGITQHIGAYQVRQNGNTITFLDTPGHEAFTAMRARGAKVTDLAVIVVAADDGVMPQTVEAIDHAKAAGVPLMVAVNKIDKDGAQPDKVRGELASQGLNPEDWGGDTLFCDVSAKTKEGLDNLLESIVLLAELEELKANPNAPASGVVIESHLDPGRGPVATLLIQRGTLEIGDAVVAGPVWGRVRAMMDFTGNPARQRWAGRSGRGARPRRRLRGRRAFPRRRQRAHGPPGGRRAQPPPEDRGARPPAGAPRHPRGGVREGDGRASSSELNIVLKSDVSGSLEALRDEIAKVPQDQVAVNVIRAAAGGINESDVMLAAASNAVVIGFNVRPLADARRAAASEGVDIRTYDVIYKVTDDLRAAMEGMLEPEEVEQSLGEAEVKQTFQASRVGRIAGCMVTEGKVTANAASRLVRDGTVVWTGKVGSLRRFKDDVKEVEEGLECGIVLEGFADVKEGDVLEFFTTKQVEKTLE